MPSEHENPALRAPPPGVPGQDRGDRDQEVLGEPLRAADRQEDKADPERQGFPCAVGEGHGEEATEASRGSSP